MDKRHFTKSLNILRRVGHLRVSELQVFFEKPYSTVRAWVEGRQLPSDFIWPEVWERYKLLKVAIERYHLFPIPADVHFTQRKRYVEQARTNPSSLVPTRTPTGKRLEMRVSSRVRRVAADSVGADGRDPGRQTS